MLNEEPPSPDRDTNNTELYIPRSSDLCCLIVGCKPLLAGIDCFRSLVILGNNRRGSLLDTNEASK